MQSSMALAERVDRLVQSTKWIAAGIAAVLSPFILHAIGVWIRRIGQYPLYASLFASGAAVVLVLCCTDVVHSRWIRHLIAAERGLTQSLLSVLMLYPVSRMMKPFDAIHPHSRWLGKGNWVILASPYFLPAASIVLWCVSWFIFPAPLRSFVIGVGVAYHVAAVILQWKHGTSEFRRLGQKFTVLFLIPANLMVIGAGFAFALDGFRGLVTFVNDIFSPLTLEWIRF
jgi:hypothetical protein